MMALMKAYAPNGKHRPTMTDEALEPEHPVSILKRLITEAQRRAYD